MNDANQSEPTQGRLGLFDAVSIIVGIVVGASIFHVPWLILANVSDPWTGLAVWLFGGILALIGGLCYAELATTYPRSGGDYEYLTRAYGSAAGFLFGWAQLMLILTASIGAMAFVFADNAIDFINKTIEYINYASSPGRLPKLPLEFNFCFAAMAVLVLTVINLFGVTIGKWTQNILTATKVLGLGLILIAGFVWAQPDKWNPPPDRTGQVHLITQSLASQSVAPISGVLAPTVHTIVAAEIAQSDAFTFPRPLVGLGIGALAIILVLYAYGGWNDAAFVAAEVRNRKRNIPLALILGISIITAIYLLVNSAYILGLGWVDVRKFGLVPVKLVERTPLGAIGARSISVLIMISALGAANGLIFTGSRVYATLGSDHRLFWFLADFGRWKPGRRSPLLSLIVQAAITLFLITVLGTRAFGGLIGGSRSEEWSATNAFDTLVSHTAPVFWFFFLLTGISVMVLRFRDPRRERPFRVPLFPVLPIIFCAMCGYMLYSSIDYVKWGSLFAVALLALGIPLFAISWLMKKP